MLSRRYRRRLLYAAQERLRPLTRRPWPSVITVLATTSLICFISYAIPRPKPANTPVIPGVISLSTDRPDETQIVTYQSTATGDQPKYLRLPSLKTEGFIQKVGIDQRRQVAVPTNIHLAGWFIQTAVPGQPGLSIIDGHLDGRSQPGIFAHLDQLKPSDTFTVELANGTLRRFSVTSVQSLPVAEAAAVLFSQTPGLSHQLNLITCAGTYSTSKGYDRRIIVTSGLVE